MHNDRMPTEVLPFAFQTDFLLQKEKKLSYFCQNLEGMTMTKKSGAQNKGANTDTSGTSTIHWTAVLTIICFFL